MQCLGAVAAKAIRKLTVDLDYSDFDGEYKLLQNLPDVVVQVGSYDPTIVTVCLKTTKI